MEKTGKPGLKRLRGRRKKVRRTAIVGLERLIEI